MQTQQLKKLLVLETLLMFLTTSTISALNTPLSTTSILTKNGDWSDLNRNKLGNSSALKSMIHTVYPSISEKAEQIIYLKNKLLYRDNFQYTWSVETVDSLRDFGRYTDIAINDDDIVFISYYDFGEKDLKCASFVNNEWKITIVDSGGDVGQYDSLALDSAGHPHISYYDGIQGALKHAYFDGSNWHNEIVDRNGDVGLDTSIAIDSSDYVHISYHDETNGDLKYAKSSDTGWDIEIVDAIGDTGEISSLALDKNNTPHISYTNRYNYHLYHAYKVHNKWVSEPVDGISVVYGSTSIAVDLDGFIHILYYDITPDHFSLKHAYQSNDGWHIEIIDPNLWNWYGTGGANIVFDSLGRIHVAYNNWLYETVNYAWKINGIWNLEFIEPSFEDSGVWKGPFTALAVDQQGIPHVSYMDMNNFEVKYAQKIEYRPSVPTPPIGTSRGKPGQIYTFTTTSQDLDGDKIQYGWDWNGDLQVDQWTGLYNSGETCEISHSWNESGSFTLRVMAMDEKGFTNGYHLDENGEFSYWSDPLPITMPYSYNPIHQFFEKLFQQFPNIFPLLRQRIGY